jgi:hypothetical protein
VTAGDNERLLAGKQPITYFEAGRFNVEKIYLER